jgi:mono/diheme cytochrome c family protein
MKSLLRFSLFATLGAGAVAADGDGNSTAFWTNFGEGVMRIRRPNANHPSHTVARLRPARLGAVALAAAAAFGLAGCNNTSGPTGPGPIGAFGGPLLPPTFGKTVVASTPPPPLSGGTLLVMHDGKYAVAADPGRDAIYVVDLAARSVLHTISLHTGDEPGRVVEDGAGHVHAALRRGGALVTVDPLAGSILARRPVCPAPRGVAWDSSTNLVWVACATGELVSLPAAGGGPIRQATVERDLRDVVVSSGSLSVTTFRTAEVLRLAPAGSVTRRDPLPSPDSQFLPHVAWRAIAGPAGAVIAVHQAATTQSLSTKVRGGYGGGGCSVLAPGGPLGSSSDAAGGSSSGALVSPGLTDDAGAAGLQTIPPSGSSGCYTMVDAVANRGTGVAPTSQPPPGGAPCGPETGAVVGVLTVVASDGTVTVNTKFAGVLPVDVAVSNDGSRLAVAAAGNAFTPGLSSFFEFDGCGVPQSAPPNSLQATAVAFDPAGHLIVQTQEPASLVVFASSTDTGTTISLSGDSRADTGFDIFHTQAGGMIACGSCHPEGGDDGHVWRLDDENRRTPSLRGTIAGTAPYHWPGDEPSLDVLVNDVYTTRMSGVPLDSDQINAVNGWVQSIPAPPAPTWVDAQAAARGKTLFESTSVGCTTCHSGPKFTNNQTMDVGTGGRFQVPPLVGVGWRAPLFHDGCATTLGGRFSACSTPAHGSIGSLTADDLSKLIAYLETL